MSSAFVAACRIYELLLIYGHHFSACAPDVVVCYVRDQEAWNAASDAPAVLFAQVHGVKLQRQNGGVEQPELSQPGRDPVRGVRGGIF